MDHIVDFQSEGRQCAKMNKKISVMIIQMPGFAFSRSASSFRAFPPLDWPRTSPGRGGNGCSSAPRHERASRCAHGPGRACGERSAGRRHGKWLRGSALPRQRRFQREAFLHRLPKQPISSRHHIIRRTGGLEANAACHAAKSDRSPRLSRSCTPISPFP